MKLSDNIKRLRKEKAISQDVLANHLGVSFQAVSKWETGAAMPDVLLIPAIASFFGVSTDELFGFNVYEIEQEVRRICDEAYTYRRAGDIAQAEIILREGISGKAFEIVTDEDILIHGKQRSIQIKTNGFERHGIHPQ